MLSVFSKILTKASKVKNDAAEWRRFKNEFNLFKELDITPRFENKWSDIYPCLKDNTVSTPFDAHYIYHPAWAARILGKINPEKHIDVSSILSFSTVLSAFIPTEFYDYRPANLNLSSLKTGSADLTKLFFEDNSIESISCMHTIEHIGLGRYGDPIDPNGDLKAIAELQRVVKINGHLLLVTPVGSPRILFNAHRIYSFELINDLFFNFQLKDFSLIDDSGIFHQSTNPEMIKTLSYGCGCFWYQKKQ